MKSSHPRWLTHDEKAREWPEKRGGWDEVRGHWRVLHRVWSVVCPRSAAQGLKGGQRHESQRTGADFLIASCISQSAAASESSAREARKYAKVRSECTARRRGGQWGAGKPYNARSGKHAARPEQIAPDPRPERVGNGERNEAICGR